MRTDPFYYGLLFGPLACSAPMLKREALAEIVLARGPLPAGSLQSAARGEMSLSAGPAWMGDVAPERQPTFAGLRTTGAEIEFALVLECDPDADRLVMRPLPSGESPLDALADPDRRARIRSWMATHAAGERSGDLLELSLANAIATKRLGPPLPEPRHIFGVTANFPSHLVHDLRVDALHMRLDALRAARPRVFLKHPATAPAGYENAAQHGFAGLSGPYDGIQYPATIPVPLGAEGAPVPVELRLDYEVEVGAVFARELTPEFVRTASDTEIRAAIAGYVLASDAKARNPQVADRLRSLREEPDANGEPYRVADEELEERLGHWSTETCAWWSYAASFGNFAALGPFLIAAPEDGLLPGRAMVLARSYVAPPKGLEPGVLYLRQCSETTECADARDALVWDVPTIVRSILAEGSVIPFPDGKPRIAAGDVICLGTPGGTVITAPRIPRVVRWALFWWDDEHWHDAFFGKNAHLYLHDGDVVFQWAEGLGYQSHRLERATSPN